MKNWLIFLLLPGAFQAAAQATVLPPTAGTGRPASHPHLPAPRPAKQVAAQVAADTLVARQFLDAVADALVSDSVVVARYMCADVLLRQRDARRDTAVALLRASLYFLRAGLLKHATAVRRSRLVPFADLPQKPPFTLTGGEAGAYVLLDGDRPGMCLLVRAGRVVAFELSVLKASGKASFHDYCR